jgi:hypothetical protein
LEGDRILSWQEVAYDVGTYLEFYIFGVVSGAFVFWMESR